MRILDRIEKLIWLIQNISTPKVGHNRFDLWWFDKVYTPYNHWNYKRHQEKVRS